METLDIKDKIGNPLFVIETYLDPLTKDIKENKVDSSLQIIERIRVSIEKIKDVLCEIVENEKPFFEKPLFKRICGNCEHFKDRICRLKQDNREYDNKACIVFIASYEVLSK